MQVRDPMDRHDAERLYATYAGLARTRRHRRRVRSAVSVGVAVTVLAAALLWAGWSLSGLNRGDQRVPATPSGGAPFAAGAYNGCAVTASHGVLCWGTLPGDGSPGERMSPVQVRGLRSGVASVATGWDFACAVGFDGSVRCWGLNDAGQTGVAAPKRVLAPVVVQGLPPAASVAAGGGHACAVTRDAAVYCWGSDHYGQLGDGATTSRSTPAPVVGLDGGVVQVATGYRHTCALLATGVVRCWGANDVGNLGDGTTSVERSTPADVRGLPADVIQIAAGAGSEHTCALTDGGDVWCWGLKINGNKHTPNRAWTPPEPVKGAPADVVSVAVGGWDTCMVTAAHVGYCVGSGSRGQLQANPIRPGSDFHVPGAMTVPGDVVGMAVAGSTVCAMTATADYYCWGNNAHGELGADRRAMSYTNRPQQVHGDWLGVG